MDDDLYADLEDLGEDDLSSDEDDGQTAHDTLLASVKRADNVTSLLKYYGSKTLADTLSSISSTKSYQEAEYPLIVSANNLSFELDNEILLANKFIKDHYAPKFPELESLLPNPVEYARVVSVIKNETNVSRLILNLPQATDMIIKVTATTTNGVPLSHEELEKVLVACDIALSLDASRKSLIDYVQSRMEFIAPNLTVILGSVTAAKLMSLAGGLRELTKIPSCNIMVMGSARQANLGLSSYASSRHRGLVYSTDLVANVPDESKRKAARLVAAKTALASRVDAARERPDGSLGLEFRRYIEKQLEIYMEPPPSKRTKALPIPDVATKKKRGGKRARAQKERMGLTELRKAQNRMAFGQAEEEIGFSTGETVGLGMINAADSGKVRAIQVDTRVKGVLSKRHKAYNNGPTHTSGFSSSVAFTPVKGIELHDPSRNILPKVGGDKYFQSDFKLPEPKRKQ